MVLYGASDIFAYGTEIVRSRFPQQVRWVWVGRQGVEP